MHTIIQSHSVFLLLFVFLFLSPSSVHAAIVINEVLPNPTGEDTELEWIELYNSESSPISLDGYILEDKNGKRITLSGAIQRWFVVYPKGEKSFALTNSGSTIRLLRSDESEVDSFNYGNSTEGKSFGRIPDGGSISSEKLSPTLESSNQLPVTPTPSPTATSTPKPTQTPKPTAITPPPVTVRVTVPSPEVLGDDREDEQESDQVPHVSSDIILATSTARMVVDSVDHEATQSMVLGATTSRSWMLFVGGGVLISLSGIALLFRSGFKLPFVIPGSDPESI